MCVRTSINTATTTHRVVDNYVLRCGERRRRRRRRRPAATTRLQIWKTHNTHAATASRSLYYHIHRRVLSTVSSTHVARRRLFLLVCVWGCWQSCKECVRKYATHARRRLRARTPTTHNTSSAHHSRLCLVKRRTKRCRLLRVVERQLVLTDTYAGVCLRVCRRGRFGARPRARV